MSQIRLKVQMSNVDGCCTKTIKYPRKVVDDYEFIYAMDVVREQIMKLNVGDRMYFSSLRDEKNSLGIITRIE